MKANNIYHLDNMNGYEMLFNSNLKIKAIVTDPPYFLENNGKGTTYINNVSKIADGLLHMENSFDFEEHFKHWRMLCKPFNLFMFCSNKQISKFMHLAEINNYITTLLVWHKPNSTPFSNNVWRPDIEYILHIRERGAVFNGDAVMKQKVKKHPAVKSKHGHPTEKPEELIKELIQICSNENDLILDPFSGSGTTAVSALQTNRKFIGFEISKKYYLASIKRISIYKELTK